jgi:outer membrane receptor for ferrienterochelin and colicin
VKKFIIIIFYLWSITLLAENLTLKNMTGSLEGTIIDVTTNQPLPGTNLTIEGTQLGATSSTKGYFQIPHVPIGRYQIKATLLGYKAEMKTEIIIATNRVTRVDFALQPTVLDIGQNVEIKAYYFVKEAERPVSIQTLSAQDIRSSPGSGQDIFRILQAMPGVSVTSANSAKLIVRGGAPEENKTLLDNLEINNPLHFAQEGSAAMGVISVINPTLIKNVEFITGGFPAEYGDKMSSVMEIKLKEGNKTQFNHDLNLSLGGFDATLDGPISNNGVMALSLRRGIFDLFTQMMNRPIMPRYWDAVGKISYQLGKKNYLSFIGFFYNDEVRKTGLIKEHAEFSRNYKYMRWDEYETTGGLNWRYLFCSRGYALTTLEYTQNHWKTTYGNDWNKKINGNESREYLSRLKSNVTYQFSTKITAKAGMLYENIDSHQERWRAADTSRAGFIYDSYSLDFTMPATSKASGFVQANIQPATRLFINLGARYDYFELTKATNWSPRLGLIYNITDQTSLTAAWGKYYQTPSTYSISQDPANSTLGNSRAIHYIVGVEQLLSADTKLKVEAYYKDLSKVFTANDTTRVITNTGSGYSQGIELSFQKKMSHRLSANIAYCWSVSKREDSETLPEYNFDYDRRHNLTFMTGYKFNDNWQLGVKFQYASGNPFTPITGAQEFMGDWYVKDGIKNSANYPAFHKLDIRIDRYFHFNNWTLNAYLDIWNVYDQKNVISYYYEVDDQGKITRQTFNDFPMMPIVGLSAQF